MSSHLAERGDWDSRRGTRSLGMKRSIRRTERQRDGMGREENWRQRRNRRTE